MLRAAISSTSRSVLRRSCASNGTTLLLPAGAASASPSFFTPSPSIRRSTPQQFSTSAASAGSTATAAAVRVPQNASDAAERTLQRFWKSVSVQAHPAAPAPPPGGGGGESLPAHYTIHLDKRALRTPSGNVMRIPIEQGLLAGLVAQEWHEQRTVLKPHALPLTSLVARSIDGLTSDSVRKGVCEGLMHYLDTDTILFHEDEPHQLVRLQDERWQPLLDWTSSHFKTPITIYKSLFNTSQSPETRSVLLAHIQTLTPLRLAAFERAVLSSKSFLVALGLLEGKLSVDDASRAAEVEVASQIERWGEVEDTHDVDYHDIRRQLGSVSIVLAPPADQQL